ncbi:DUF2326 domain-containing protein [Maridesulfovibrio sp.]|uniref:DUF2326 domain-containing protein n=1 Tax=Maridesulfovibrio sp. TaxID=2795000 RepID=UPI003B003DB2
MILSKIYAEGGEFNTVDFNPGLNVIMGSCTRKGEAGADQHNLGKTLFVDVVDFALLSSVSSEHAFKKKKTFFNRYTFYLEIKLKDGTFVTVKRSIAKMNKASFLVAKESVDAREVDEWTYKDVSLRSTSGVNAQEMLKTLLQIDSIESMSLRSLLAYSMRRQDDYGETFNINDDKKLIIWMPRLLSFVGLNGDLLKKKLSLDDGVKTFTSADKILKEAGVYDSPEVSSSRNRLNALRTERSKIERSIGDVSFFEEDEGVSRSVVKNCDAEISKLNIERYKLQFDIEKVSRVIETDYIDIDEINAIYHEAEIAIPEYIVKSYEELLEFNRQIWADRQGVIEMRLEEMRQKLNELDLELVELDGQRKDLLIRLKRQDVIDRYKKNRLRINEIDSEIDALQDYLSNIMDAEKIGLQKDTLKEKLKEDVTELKNMGVVTTQSYAEFVRFFHALAKDILGREVKLTFDVNTKGNVYFHYEFKSKDEGENLLFDKGTTYKKLLSVCFDIALILKYSTKNHFSFVVHDGVWDTLGDTLKLNHLRVLRELMEVFDCQFILTLLDDDIPKSYTRGDLFNDNEVVLELDDREDNTGRLFKSLF